MCVYVNVFVHVHIYFVSFLSARSSSKWVIPEKPHVFISLRPLHMHPKSNLLHLHASLFDLVMRCMESQILQKHEQTCAVQLNKLFSISLFINQLLLYQLLMTNYPCETQWAVPDQLCADQFGQSCTLMGRTSKCST